MLNEQVESVMAIAFELARIREKHGAQSNLYLSEVRALRAELTYLALQGAATSDFVEQDDAFKEYIADCDRHAIVPDTAGAFNWAWNRRALLKRVGESDAVLPTSARHATSVGSVMRLVEDYAFTYKMCIENQSASRQPLNESRDALRAEVTRLAEQGAAPIAADEWLSRSEDFMSRLLVLSYRRGCTSNKTSESLNVAQDALQREFVAHLKARITPAPQAVQAGEYPPLPEWAKQGDLIAVHPDAVAQALRAYADATCALRAARVSPAQAEPPSIEKLRADFHQWCATNGYKTRFVEGGECPMGLPVYDDHRTHAAWWAFQKAAKLYATQSSATPPASAEPKDARTSQDYAIEHAEYMAVYGERVNAAVNDLAKAVQEFEDGQANESDVDAAQETLGEAQRALRDATYEFRKRRDRALRAAMEQESSNE